MSSIRQQIVDAIETRLGQIAVGKVWTLEDGSTHTCTVASKGVYPWRKVPFSPTQLPAIAIYDGGSTLEDGPIGSFSHALEVSIVGYIASSSPVNTARELAADILAAVGSDHRWGGLAQWSYVESLPLDIEPAGDVVAAGEIKLTVHYRTGRWQL